MNSFVGIIFFVISLSIDAFVSSFAFGTDKIKMPIKSVLVINLVCRLFLLISLFFGTLVGQLIPKNITSTICFIILFILGIIKLFDSFIKTLIRNNNCNKKITFSIFNIRFVLNIYADPKTADFDCSKELSVREAIYLAIALSFDGIVAGFGFGLNIINYFWIILLSFISDFIAIILGCYLGNKVAEKMSLNLSWVSGAILILLAIMKL